MTDHATYWIETQETVIGPDTVITISHDNDDLGMIQLTVTEYSSNPDVAPVSRDLRFTPKQARYVSVALERYLDRLNIPELEAAEITE